MYAYIRKSSVMVVVVEVEVIFMPAHYKAKRHRCAVHSANEYVFNLPSNCPIDRFRVPEWRWDLNCSVFIITVLLLVLITATRCCSASLTICCGVFRPYKTPQHVLLLVYSTSWAHHARLEAASLAASATAHWIQAGSFVVQGAEWPVSAIFDGWLPAYHYYWLSTTSIVRRRCMWHSKNSHKSEWSIIHCCWTTSMEQPTSLSAWFSTYSPRVPLVTEDASVLLRTAPPSDRCF